MKQWTKRMGAATLAAGAIAVTSGAVSASAAAAEAKARSVSARQVQQVQIVPNGEASALQNVMVVQGSGEVSVTPDIARVSVGVYTENGDAGKAAEENATKTEAVIRALKAFGVAEKDIRTSGYSINRRSYRMVGPVSTGSSGSGGGGFGSGAVVDSNGQIITNNGSLVSPNNAKAVVNNSVTNNVIVTVRKVSDTGRVLDAAIKAGANQMGDGYGGGSGVTFAVDNPVAAREKALKLAVANAQSKARALAEAAGLASYFLVRIEENGGDYAPTRGGAEAFVGRASAATPVLPGEQTVSASVTITYRIVPKLIPLQP